MNLRENHLNILYRWTRYRSWFDLGSALIALGYRRIAIYGGGLLGTLLFEALAEGPVQVAGLIDQNPALRFPYPVKTVTPDQAKTCGPVDAVIIACTDWAPIRENLLRLAVPAGDIVALDDLIIDVDDFLLFQQTLQHAAAQGAKLLLCDFTPPLYHKNPTPFEAMARYVNHYNWLKDDPRCLETYYDDVAGRPEDYAAALLQMTESISLIRQGGVSRLADARSPYYTVIDHCRLTTGVPDRFDHTIHFFGNCVSVGCYTEDCYTIESQLQRKLRENPPNGVAYRVINRANWKSGGDMFLSVLHSRFDEGDTVVLISSDLRRFSYYFKNLRYYDLVPAFDRPHKYGEKEIFFDHYHMNHRGYGLLADYLYNILLREEDVVEGETVSPRIPAKLRLRPRAGSAQDAPKDDTRAEDDGLARYQRFLRGERAGAAGCVGSIVMNANPFSLGHRYLVEKALEQCDFLYVFVVQEDKSEFPFSERIAMVREGLADLGRVKVLPGGRFIISSQTLPEYFIKERQDVTVDATRDLQTFAEAICPVLNITKRFIGEEPLCAVTRQYNAAMKETLPRYGISVIEFPRVASGGGPISATRIRAALREGRLNDLSTLAPPSTIAHLRAPGAGKDKPTRE